MKLNTPIRRGTPDWQRAMIEMETEDDSEITNQVFPLQTVQSWPASSESTPPEVDALLCTEALGLPGVPYAERPERTDEPAAVAVGVALMVRQAV